MSDSKCYKIFEVLLRFLGASIIQIIFSTRLNGLSASFDTIFFNVPILFQQWCSIVCGVAQFGFGCKFRDVVG